MEQNILVTIGGDISDLSSSLSQAGRELSTFSSQTERGFQAIGNVGKVVTAGGVALAAGLGVAVKTAMDFETQMSRVGALSGATDGELLKLTNSAKTLGETTVYSARYNWSVAG